MHATAPTPFSDPVCLFVSCLPVLVLQGRGAATGYDYAVALPASGDSEELAKENAKSAASLKGESSTLLLAVES
jgi:hypothetical protein